jgi:hypothetical protein
VVFLPRTNRGSRGRVELPLVFKHGAVLTRDAQPFNQPDSQRRVTLARFGYDCAAVACRLSQTLGRTEFGASPCFANTPEFTKVHMEPKFEAEVTWLSSLTAAERSQFLTHLAHGLTIGIRVLCHVDRDAQANVESIRLTNEAVHRVLGYLSYSQADTHSSSWLVTVVESVLLINDAAAIQQASQAWLYAKSQVSSAGAA